MTVKELIESLSKFPEDLEVCITDLENDETADGEQIFHPVNGVETETSDDKKYFVFLFHHEDF